MCYSYSHTNQPSNIKNKRCNQNKIINVNYINLQNFINNLQINYKLHIINLTAILFGSIDNNYNECFDNITIWLDIR